MKKLLLTLGLLMGSTAQASEFRLLDLNEMSFEYYKIKSHLDPFWGYQNPDGTDPNVPKWDWGIRANFDLNLASYGPVDLYWQNGVHGEVTNEPQFREVGWQYEAGLNIADKANLFYRHHSRHILDDYRDEHFPVDDYYGLRIIFYKRK